MLPELIPKLVQMASDFTYSTKSLEAELALHTNLLFMSKARIGSITVSLACFNPHSVLSLPSLIHPVSF